MPPRAGTIALYVITPEAVPAEQSLLR